MLRLHYKSVKAVAWLRSYTRGIGLQLVRRRSRCRRSWCDYHHLPGKGQYQRRYSKSILIW